MRPEPQQEITLESRLATNPNLVLRIEADDCGLLFDPDSGRVQMLNDTAIGIWQRLDGQRTLAEVLDSLRQDYDDIPAGAAEQILKLVKQFAAAGAVGVWESS